MDNSTIEQMLRELPLELLIEFVKNLEQQNAHSTKKVRLLLVA